MHFLLWVTAGKWRHRYLECDAPALGDMPRGRRKPHPRWAEYFITILGSLPTYGNNEKDGLSVVSSLFLNSL